MPRTWVARLEHAEARKFEARLTAREILDWAARSVDSISLAERLTPLEERDAAGEPMGRARWSG
jgi:hypothetical protein